MISKNWMTLVVLFGILLAGCTPLAPIAAAASATPPATTSPTLTPTASITASASPSQTPSITPSITPTPTPTPPESIAGWTLVYRPSDTTRSVAGVRWSEDGRMLYYALSPEPNEYLLDWFAFDPIGQGTRAIRSPNFGFAEVWRRAEVGYPITAGPFSELLGFTSPEYKKAIYPNAGFPDKFTNPNYIYVIDSDNRTRQRVLGPIFRGTVGRASWIDFETRVIFDYRYEGRLILYLADLFRGRTETLFEVMGEETEWRVSPDEKYLLVPQNGRSELLPLNGDEPLSLDTPGGMARPEWSRDSQTIYFWAGEENRILSYTPADQSKHSLLVRRDLEPFSPVPPVYGMPFRISPDQTRIAFWWENWIWIVELAAAP